MSFGKTSGGYQWLLVCLGNPGRQYEGTRQNIGFMAADELARREGIKINRLRYRALTGELRLGGQRVLVLKPQTFMNLSGEAVKLAGGFYKIPRTMCWSSPTTCLCPWGSCASAPAAAPGATTA